MYINTHALKRMIFKRKYLILLLMFSILVLILTFNILINDFPSPESPEYTKTAIKAIATEEKIFLLTVNIYGDEDADDVELLSEVCNGFGVKVTFFATPSWIKENHSAVMNISDAEHTFGLFITKNLSNSSRNEVMRYMANQNDEFFENTGKYPKYVRLTEEKTGKLPEVLNAFCQYNISQTAVIDKTNVNLIENGIILTIDSPDSTAPYLCAEILGNAMRNGITAIGIKDFLYNMESEVDAFGYQKKEIESTVD